MQVTWRRRVSTPQGDYDGFLQAMLGLVAEADTALGRSDAAIGIALPGVRDRRTGRQLSANVPALTGHSVAADLQARLQRRLHFGNDLQCFALSEAHGGAAEGYPSMFGAILGTGAGGGFCLQGRLLSGFNGLAGEWGHWSVPGHLLQRHGLPLIDCACGLQGCVERYVSGSGLAMIERHLGGNAADASAVIALAEAGDARARQALDIHRDLLGHSLAALVLALDPHVIVLGGGLSQYVPLYQQLPAAISAHLFNGVQVPPIVPPRFGDAGGARGAALLACQPSFS
jgi:N-acetylglucosamine kinase